MVAGGACMVAGAACVGHNEIWSMSGQYASYNKFEEVSSDINQMSLAGVGWDWGCGGLISGRGSQGGAGGGPLQ